MNEEDYRMEADEQDAASPRYSSQATRAGHYEEVEAPLRNGEKEEKTEQLSRHHTAASSSRSSVESIRRPSNAVSRMTTQQEKPGEIERHPTALSRIQTGRSVHSNTIGTGIRSRTSTRQSKTPMPNFGAGKPFPPPLPDREEYVVEFDGPHGV
jgi:DHA1 family multidrug resistance protein-like MFS transporter